VILIEHLVVIIIKKNKFDIHVTAHHDKFLIINQLDALISHIHFQNETLRVSDSSSVCFILILILLASCQQTCKTYTIAVCTVKNS